MGKGFSGSGDVPRAGGIGRAPDPGTDLFLDAVELIQLVLGQAGHDVTQAMLELVHAPLELLLARVETLERGRLVDTFGVLLHRHKASQRRRRGDPQLVRLLASGASGVSITASDQKRSRRLAAARGRAGRVGPRASGT